MRRWVITLGVLLAVGGVALVGARAWFVSELEVHKDVLFLGMISGDGGSTETILAVALWGGVALVAIGAAMGVISLRIPAAREVPIALVIAVATVALLIAIPAAMFGLELGRKRTPAGVATPRTPATRAITNPIGCADGSREAFEDVEAFPRIAACAGTWNGALSLRKAATRVPCGGDDACASPADLCAPGWHVCSSANELTVVTAAQCEDAGEGPWLAAMSSSANEAECDPGLADAMPCRATGASSAAVCCGEACVDGVCRDAVWRGATSMATSRTACAASTAGAGVLCCPN